MTAESAPTAGTKSTLIIEAAMAFLVVAAIGYLIYFFVINGYLPAPFFHDIDDTFMDWYNAAIWVYKPGAYQVYLSVYPPLSFVFQGLFTEKSCYTDIGRVARDCDPVGMYVLAAFMLINFVLAYLIYRKADSKTALPRAIALSFGTSMLFAWERGNLILPCFTFFMLGHGRLLRSAWVKWLCVAVSINFKPYLVLPLVGGVLRRRWRWAEGCAVAIVMVYAISFAWFGQGSPMEVLANLTAFTQNAYRVPSLDSIAYASTFRPLLDFLESPYPIMHYIGSRPMETMERFMPLATRLGELGAFASLAGAILRPTAVPVHRLAALSMALFLTLTEPGLYTESLLFFFVFMERWNGPGQAVALIAAYILCVPFDYQFLGIAHQIKNSYLSGRAVGYDLGLTVGDFARPALMLMVEYGLAVASLSDILRGPVVAMGAPARPATMGRAQPSL